MMSQVLKNDSDPHGSQWNDPSSYHPIHSMASRYEFVINTQRRLAFIFGKKQCASSFLVVFER